MDVRIRGGWRHRAHGRRSVVRVRRASELADVAAPRSAARPVSATRRARGEASRRPRRSRSRSAGAQRLRGPEEERDLSPPLPGKPDVEADAEEAPSLHALPGERLALSLRHEPDEALPHLGITNTAPSATSWSSSRGYAHRGRNEAILGGMTTSNDRPGASEPRSAATGEQAPGAPASGLYGQRPSRSHDDLARKEFRRIDAMSAREPLSVLSPPF